MKALISSVSCLCCNNLPSPASINFRPGFMDGKYLSRSLHYRSSEKISLPSGPMFCSDHDLHANLFPCRNKLHSNMELFGIGTQFGRKH
jgi:hypothetical protein